MCAIGFYCPGDGLVVACRPGSESMMDTSAHTACYCKTGFQEQSDGSCMECPANSFCSGNPSTSKSPCPAHSTNEVGSSTASSCMCEEGFYSSTPGAACIECTEGSFCQGGNADQNKALCPSQSFSPAGSSSVSDCSCNPGFYGSATNCALCSQDYYCESGGRRLACPEHSSAGTGSTSCTCELGYEVADDGSCFKCPSNSYCPGGGAGLEIACGINAESPSGSYTAHQCSCVVGYSNTAFEVEANWFAVGPASFEENTAACAAGDGVIASINSLKEAEIAAKVCQSDVAECYIGLKRAGPGPENSENPDFTWIDQHSLDFTAYELGQPQVEGPETVVVFTSRTDGLKWHGWGDGTKKLKAVCKKSGTSPTCEQGYSPVGLGMRSGFVTDFFYVGKPMQTMPERLLATVVPNFEGIADTVPFYDEKDFSTLDPNIPQDMLAGTFIGMLKIEVEGQYTFYTSSNSGSHLYIDGTMVGVNVIYVIGPTSTSMGPW